MCHGLPPRLSHDHNNYRNKRDYLNNLISYFGFFRSYSDYCSFFRNINIPNYFIAFYYFKKVHNSGRYHGCCGSAYITCFCFVCHFHVPHSDFLLYIYLYIQYIYFFLFYFIEKYKDLYSMKYNFLIEIYKDLGFRGLLLFCQQAPFLSERGDTKRMGERW